jgi:predicted dehydrogenase
MVSRRKFLGFSVASIGTTALANKAAALDPAMPMHGFAAPRMEPARVGIIGVGGRGYHAVRRLMRFPGIRLVAACDIREAAVARAAAELKYYNYNAALKVFHGSPTAYRAMNDLDLDVVYIATPWNEHAPMALDAMSKGKHALVEVPICRTLEEGFALIEAAEKHKKHCMMLENVCYGRTEMALLNMVKAGLFGTIVHAEASYIHYLTEGLFEGNEYPRRWRLKECMKRNGNLYPTHGLGPVSKYLGILRDDTFDEIISMSSIQAGLTEFALEHYGRDSAEYRTRYALGDMNTSLIRTTKGRTIMVQHDTTSPQPYSRHNVITGTKGVFMGFPDRLYFHQERRHPRFETYVAREYLSQYDHEDWRAYARTAKRVGGHGGIDYIMDMSWIRNVNEGRPMDISVDESVLWSIVAPLSERSVASGHRPVKFPRL